MLPVLQPMSRRFTLGTRSVLGGLLQHQIYLEGKKMIVTMMPKKINMHLILWYQWRRMKTPVEMEEAFV